MHVPPLLRILLLVLVCVPLVFGCGDGVEESPGAAWHRCELRGARQIGGAAVFGEELLLISGGGDGRLFAVALTDLVPGGTAQAREVPLDITHDAPLSGREEIAWRGTTLGQLQDLGMDFQALAVQEPHFLFVGDAAFRLGLWGRIERGPTGTIRKAKLFSGFVVPGGERPGTASADYRDHGPGLRSFVTRRGTRHTEDLLAISRGETDHPGRIRVDLLDRGGALLQLHRLQGLGTQAADVEAACWQADRLLVYRDHGSGSLHPGGDPSVGLTGTLGRGTPAPERPEGATWRGMSSDPDDTLYLVSDGDPAVVAWRKAR